MKRRRFGVRFALLAAALVLGATDAAATEVRRRIGLLSLEGPPGTERRIDALAVRAGTILPQLESDLGVRPASRFRMILVVRGAPIDSTLAPLDQAAPEWAAGYMASAVRIGGIREDQASHYPYGTLEAVLAHEITHLLLHDASAGRLPLWFEEGVATWQGRKWSLEDAMVVSGSLLTSDLPRLADLDAAFHASESEASFAYAASFAFVARAVRRHGSRLLPDLLREARVQPFPEAWARVTGESLAVAETAWRRESLIRYRWIPVITASSTLWIGITLLAVAAGIRKRERSRKLREQWRAEEAENPEGEFGAAAGDAEIGMSEAGASETGAGEPGAGEPGASETGASEPGAYHPALPPGPEDPTEPDSNRHDPPRATKP